MPESLGAFLRRTRSSSKVLIPGSGADSEVIRAFHEAGHEVTAIDFSPTAVDLAKDALGTLEDRIILGDFFAYDFGSRLFDFVYERTFLCSLPPSVWEIYVSRVAQLLSVGGKLVGFFLYGNEPEPPPYPLGDKRANELFDKQFRLVRNEAVSDSVPMFAGMERWQEWIRRGEAA